MVLCLKARESRSLPGLPSARDLFRYDSKIVIAHGFDAGWSSPVARQAHNLKVVGSNPAPATNSKKAVLARGRFFVIPARQSPGETDVLHDHAPHRHRRRPPHRHARIEVPPSPRAPLYDRGDVPGDHAA